MIRPISAAGLFAAAAFVALVTSAQAGPVNTETLRTGLSTTTQLAQLEPVRWRGWRYRHYRYGYYRPYRYYGYGYYRPYRYYRYGYPRYRYYRW